MRCFIAIDVSKKIKSEIANLQQKLQEQLRVSNPEHVLSKVEGIKPYTINWVESGSIHLTLNFLGEVQDKLLGQICNAVKEVANRHKNFYMDVESVGSFGGKSAKVLWVAAGEKSPELLELQNDLAEQFAMLGWPKEARKFAGHLTLCRIKNSAAGIELAKISENYKQSKLGTFLANSVSIYQSQLTSGGAVYNMLASYKLS
ncbi:MAG: RNA 2',3'-cyclic phosphodiesterase [Planctomycetes bacterium]|nr:RNA 2',3'-cyclic phosphodiesterase [Planctomycetota bacterium]